MEQVVTILALFMPLILILWLANLADRQREHAQQDSGQILAAITYALLVLMYLTFLSLGLVLQAIGIMSGGSLPQGSAEAFEQMGIDPANMAAALPRIGLGLWLPSVFGILLLLRPVRRLFARLIPIDPSRTVHAVALSYPMLILVNLLVTLGIGIGNLASLMQASSTGEADPYLIASVWAQEVAFAIMAVVGVGWLARRNIGDALRRLGLVLPTVRQVAAGVGIGLGLVPVVLLFEFLASWVGITPSSDVERLSEQVIGPLAESLVGVVTLGLAAALGEETLFRGALQPRFGIFLTALLFALLHSTYGLTLSTLLVFLVGLVLCLVRQRWNTSTAMVVHAIYNMSLGMLTYLNAFQNF